MTLPLKSPQASSPRLERDPGQRLSERPRRLRSSASLRDLVAETRLAPSDLVMPYFVVPGRGETQPVAALPGIARYSPDLLLRQLERGLKLGLRAAMLFGVVPLERKDPAGSSAADPEGPVPQALRAARTAFGDEIVLMSDVCLCAHTDHGHCGLLRGTERGVVVDNDSSLGALAAMALVQAEAGADFVSPSDMMDGRVAALRSALDAQGHSGVGILAYAVKYASAFYGPFREAAGSSPNPPASLRSPPPLIGRAGGVPSDRRSYQMDPRNAREALREAALDEREGADLLMVKPALPYLDVLARLRRETTLPLVAYCVSGEYAMLKAAAKVGALEEAPAVLESLNAIRRAGADLILSYHAAEALERDWL